VRGDFSLLRGPVIDFRNGCSPFPNNQAPAAGLDLSAQQLMTWSIPPPELVLLANVADTYNLNGPQPGAAGLAVSIVMFSMLVSPLTVLVVTIHHSGLENSQAESALNLTGLAGSGLLNVSAIIRFGDLGLFIKATKRHLSHHCSNCGAGVSSFLILDAESRRHRTRSLSRAAQARIAGSPCARRGYDAVTVSCVGTSQWRPS